jgi:DNA sulfur modification protein DndE
MFKSIKTSEANRKVVADLTSKLGMGPENLIARIALAYSIAQGRRLNPADLEDSKGKEYSGLVLFGEYSTFYVAIVCQLYGLHKTDYDIPKYIKMHIDDGLRLISEVIRENKNLPLFDFILDQIENGLKTLVND